MRMLDRCRTHGMTKSGGHSWGPEEKGNARLIEAPIREDREAGEYPGEREREPKKENL